MRTTFRITVPDARAKRGVLNLDPVMPHVHVLGRDWRGHRQLLVPTVPALLVTEGDTLTIEQYDRLAALLRAFGERVRPRRSRTFQQREV